MVNKELKRLSRRELVDIIYLMKKNEQSMQEEIASLQASVQDKRIRLSQAGSVAEAAADITQLFSAAQQTADLYLNEIASMKADAEKECERMIEDARKQVAAILAEAEKMFDDVKTSCFDEREKLQQLQEEVKKLEEIKEQESGGE